MSTAREKWAAWGEAIVELIQPVLTTLASPVRAWLVAVGNSQMAAWSFVALFGIVGPIMLLHTLYGEQWVGFWEAETRRIELNNAKAEAALEPGEKDLLAKFNSISYGITPTGVRFEYVWLKDVTHLVVSAEYGGRGEFYDFPINTDAGGVPLARQSVFLSREQLGDLWLPNKRIRFRLLQQRAPGRGVWYSGSLLLLIPTE